MDPCVPDIHNCSQLDFSPYWADCTIESAIHRGHELRREKPEPLPPREFGVLNVDAGRSPGCRRRKHNRMRRSRRSRSPCCCSISRRSSPMYPTCKRARPDRYRTHCGMRIAELAVPTKRHCLDTWRSAGCTLPPYMVERLRKIVKDQQPVVAISDALYCFKRVCKRNKKPSKYDERCERDLDRKEKVACIISLLSGSDTSVLCAIFGHKIARKLAIPRNVVLTPELQSIACAIWCDIACMMRCPCQKAKGIYTRSYKQFEQDIVMKITIWIAQILEDTREIMIEDDIREFEEEYKPALDAVDDIINGVIERIPDEPVTPKEKSEDGDKDSTTSTPCDSFIEITIEKIDKDGNVIVEIPDPNVGDQPSEDKDKSEFEDADDGQTPDPGEGDGGEDIEKDKDITDTTLEEQPENNDDTQEPTETTEDIDPDKGDNISDSEKPDTDIPDETKPDDDVAENEENEDDTTIQKSPSTEDTAIPPNEGEEDALKPDDGEEEDTDKDTVSQPNENQDGHELPAAPPPDVDVNVDDTNKPLPADENIEIDIDVPIPAEIPETVNTEPKENEDKDDEFLESEDSQQPTEPPQISDVDNNVDDVPEKFDDATDNNNELDPDKTVTFDQDVRDDQASPGKRSVLDFNWKASIEHISFSEPNRHLLSDADESWPDDILPPILRPSQSVSKSITSLGNIKEADEHTSIKSEESANKVEEPKEPKEPTPKDEDAIIKTDIDVPAETDTKPEEKPTSEDRKSSEDTPDKSKPRKSKDSTSSRDSKGQKTKPREDRTSDSKKPRSPPKRPSSITSSKRTSQDSKGEPTSPATKPRPIPKKPRDTPDDKSKKPKTKEPDSTKPRPSVKDADIKTEEEKPTLKKKPDYRVNFKDAPIWINRNINEPSCNCFQIASKTKQEKPKTNDNLVRRWCKDLERGYDNLKMWNDWVEHTTRTVSILQREIEQVAGKSYCAERCSNKELMKLKRCIDRDAQMWKKLNLHTQERLRCYRKLYQKRSEKSCSSNYLICCSKTKI